MAQYVWHTIWNRIDALTELTRTQLCRCRQLLLLGTYNFAYNLASQLVLANVAVVSHGMMELFKRIFVLVTASVFLQVSAKHCCKSLPLLLLFSSVADTHCCVPGVQDVEWQWHNVVGAAIACAATAMYFRCSHHSSHSAPPPHTYRASHTHPASTDARPTVEQKAAASVYGSRMGAQGSSSSDDNRYTDEGGGDAGQQGIIASAKRSSVAGPSLTSTAAWQPGHPLMSYVKPPNQASSFIILLASPAGRSWIAQWLITALLLASPIQFVQGVDLGDIRPARAWTSWAAGASGGPGPGLALQGTGAGGGEQGAWPIPHLSGPAFVAGINGNPWSPYLQHVRTHHRAPRGESVCSSAPGAKQHAKARQATVVGAMSSGSIASHDSLGYGHQTTRNQGAVQHLSTRLLRLARRVLQLEQQQHHHHQDGQPALRQTQEADLTSTLGTHGSTAGALFLEAAVSDFNKGRDNGTSTTSGRAAPPSAAAMLGIYTGWIGRDNLGDEVVADIFFDLLVEAVSKLRQAHLEGGHWTCWYPALFT